MKASPARVPSPASSKPAIARACLLSILHEHSICLKWQQEQHQSSFETNTRIEAREQKICCSEQITEALRCALY